jgi:3-oxo-5-alpha-steroid 4-dehydrogenase 1
MLVLYPWLCGLVFVTGIITFAALFWVTAPYGRHGRPGWGPTVSSRVGWVVMESPAVIVPILAYAGGPLAGGRSLLLLGLWLLHYVHRAWIFPFRLRSTKPMPLSIVGLAIAYNVVNGTVNGWALSHRPIGPLLVPGIVLYLAGLAANLWSDTVLLRLQGQGYRIPKGVLFARVSCPNYLAEIVEWRGWAIATGNLAGASFAFFTFTNLAPRAVAHHRWYQAAFPDYPPERAALIPFVW